jgi:ABC-2 type transport system permease protein
VSWSRVRAIFRKDMRDALRDSRVLTALIMPLAFGLLYSLMFDDEAVQTQKVKVGIVSSGETELRAAITKEVGPTVRLTFVAMPDEQRLQDQVRRKKVDVGLVVPAGFDAAVKAGASPSLTLLVPSSPSVNSDFVAAILDRSVEAMAGRAPPAQIVRRSLPPERGTATALDVLGARKDFILVAIVMLLAMIAVYAVPAVLVEETEKKTMEALTLIASTPDVIAAKALFGIVLSLVGVPVLLVITRAEPADVGVLAAVVLLSAVVLVGIGLLASGFFKSQQQLNTWSGLILLALLAPAFTIGIPTPDVVNRILWFIPTGHSFRLMANAFAGRAIYPYGSLSVVALVAWAIGAYGLLWWRLSRQEAV